MLVYCIAFWLLLRQHIMLTYFTRLNGIPPFLDLLTPRHIRLNLEIFLVWMFLLHDLQRVQTSPLHCCQEAADVTEGGHSISGAPCREQGTPLDHTGSLLRTLRRPISRSICGGREECNAHVRGSASLWDEFTGIAR